MNLQDPATLEFIQGLEAWHNSRITQLQLVIDNKDSDIVLGDVTIPHDSDSAKGIRTGLAIAVDILGELPFQLSGGADEG